MPWSSNDPPDPFKDMPKKAMDIALAAANSHIGKNPDEEVKAIRIGIAAVKNAGWILDKDTGWVKNDMGIYSVVENCVANANRIGEDEHFIHYKVTVTSPGIHNDRYKPPETIAKIPEDVIYQDSADGIIPMYNDHPDDPFDPKWAGYFSNWEIENDGTTVKWVGVDHVPKSDEDTVKKLDNGDITHVSIFGYCSVDEVAGTIDGGFYNGIERDIETIHIARMDSEEPANVEALYNSKLKDHKAAVAADTAKTTPKDGEINMSKDDKKKPEDKPEEDEVPEDEEGKDANPEEEQKVDTKTVDTPKVEESKETDQPPAKVEEPSEQPGIQAVIEKLDGIDARLSSVENSTVSSEQLTEVQNLIKKTQAQNAQKRREQISGIIANSGKMYSEKEFDSNISDNALTLIEKAVAMANKKSLGLISNQADDKGIMSFEDGKPVKRDPNTGQVKE